MAQSRPARFVALRFQRIAIALVTFMAGQGMKGEDVATPMPEPMNAAGIHQAAQKLNVLGRVLYLAAHPDDENTNLMALWTNGALYDTGYLSVTRGDGGQNLIGPELGERLGVIRTCELLAARHVDHGQQFFTRALDFGFSKSAAETLRFWDRDKILSDIVWIIRKFRPDVVVTRFSPDDQLTHGHHTASAILAQEAFAAAADPKRFPEQLGFVKVWQPKRLVWNTSPFFFQARKQAFDPTGLTTMEAGGFNPLLGKAYTEIAAASLSMHKSQGVGSPPRRGERKEYFKLLNGAPMAAALFDGVDTTWTRVPGSDAIAAKVQQLIANYSATDPSASIPKLIELRQLLAGSTEEWATAKRREVEALIASCAAVYLESSTSSAIATPGQSLPIKLEAISRSKVPVKMISARSSMSGESMDVAAVLGQDQFVVKDLAPTVPADTAYSQPYWLRKPATIGTFTVDDQHLIGLAENPPAFPIDVTLEIAGQQIQYSLDTRFRRVDPVAGEVHDDVVIAPAVFANLPSAAFVFGDDKAKVIPVKVSASTGPVHGEARLNLPNGWRVAPASARIELNAAEDETTLEFTVTPPANSGEGKLRAVISTDGKDYSFAREVIDYPHIGSHTLMPPAEAKLVRADIRKRGELIGYIPGAGDEIPRSLEQIGYNVKILAPADITAANLARFDAVVLGIRAYNTQNRIVDWQKQLLAYVESGGVVVAQYNTTAELKTKDVGPYPLEISRDRVTDETAEVRFLAPEHPVLTTPNKITPDDFKGWVQERGVYFPDKWDPRWTAILSSNDPGEKPSDGGLLIAKFGKGSFVYTGYSWFRQLPAGVPGAYRLFANLVSLRGPK